jgi:hypothetical protein
LHDLIFGLEKFLSDGKDRRIMICEKKGFSTFDFAEGKNMALPRQYATNKTPAPTMKQNNMLDLNNVRKNNFV